MLVMIVEIPIIANAMFSPLRESPDRSGIVVVKVVVRNSISNMINVSRDITY